MKRFEDMTTEEQLGEAERRNLRRSKGLGLAPDPEELAARSREDDDRLEKEIQSDVMDRLRAFNFKVYNLSQPRATKQSAGLGDVYAIHPDRSRALWFETKTPTNGQSPDQKEFESFHVAAAIPGLDYVCGGVFAVEEYLILIGAAVRMTAGAIEPTRGR